MMEKELNFTSTYYECVDRSWGDLLPNGSSYGMVGMTHEGHVDLISTSLTLRSSRAKAVSYLHPIAFETHCLLIKTVQRYSILYMYVQ